MSDFLCASRKKALDFNPEAIFGLFRWDSVRFDNRIPICLLMPCSEDIPWISILGIKYAIFDIRYSMCDLGRRKLEIQAPGFSPDLIEIPVIIAPDFNPGL
jgi:hypothetical protein